MEDCSSFFLLFGTRCFPSSLLATCITGYVLGVEEGVIEPSDSTTSSYTRNIPSL